MDQDRLPRPFWLQPLLSVSSRRRLFRRRFLRNTFHSSTSPICENIPSQSCHILKVSPHTFTLGIQRLIDRELRFHIHSDHSYIQGLSVAKATDLSLWFLSLSFPFFSALKNDIVIIGLCNGQQLTVLCHKIHLFSHRRCLLKCPISSHPGSLVKPPLKFLKTLQVSLGLNNNKKYIHCTFNPSSPAAWTWTSSRAPVNHNAAADTTDLLSLFPEVIVFLFWAYS